MAMHYLLLVCNNHLSCGYIFRLIVHPAHCKLERFWLISNQVRIFLICPSLRGGINDKPSDFDLITVGLVGFLSVCVCDF